MTMNPRGKREEEEESDQAKVPTILTPSSSSSSRQWSSTFKNPRIVRVSRTFGGKDRHSKVCTVRGLRDRRIRLSVPTAIQLYDLQDRLGLNQPSKVIDWLIDATKHEIDKLPPLPMIPTNLLHYFHQPYPLPNSSLVPHEQALLSPNLYKEREMRWNGAHQQNGDEGFGGFVAHHNFFPTFPNWPPYNSNYFHLDTSQLGGGFIDQNSSSSQASTSQIYCPSEASITPPFPLYISPSLENDQFRQMNHLQQNLGLMPTTLHLINPPLKSFSLPSEENQEGNEEKENRSS